LELEKVKLALKRALDDAFEKPATTGFCRLPHCPYLKHRPPDRDAANDGQFHEDDAQTSPEEPHSDDKNSANRFIITLFFLIFLQLVFGGLKAACAAPLQGFRALAASINWCQTNYHPTELAPR
jgi:hypothetical protein